MQEILRIFACSRQGGSKPIYGYVCVCVCVCACACVRACVRACVCVHARARVRGHFLTARVCRQIDKHLELLQKLVCCARGLLSTSKAVHFQGQASRTTAEAGLLSRNNLLIDMLKSAHRLLELSGLNCLHPNSMPGGRAAVKGAISSAAAAEQGS